MQGIIRINGSEFKGCTVSGAIRRLAASGRENVDLLKKAYFVMRNGNYLNSSDYDSVIITATDEITVIPLVIGG